MTSSTRVVCKGRGRKGDSGNKGENSDTGEQSQASPKGRRQAVKCFDCGGPGHIKSDCPNRVDRSEATGKFSNGPESGKAAVSAEVANTATLQGDRVAVLSDEQLEGILASRRCLREQELLNSSEVCGGYPLPNSSLCMCHWTSFT